MELRWNTPDFGHFLKSAKKKVPTQQKTSSRLRDSDKVGGSRGKNRH